MSTEQTTPDRRAFLGGMARTVAYVAPAVIALKATRHAMAAPSCQPNGSACAADPDCCAGLFCKQPNGMPCGSGMSCTCQP